MAIAESISLLTKLSALLLIGLSASALARKLKISNVLILLLLGLGLGNIGNVFVFSPVLLISMGILTLALVVFQGTSKLSYRQIDLYSGPVLKLTVWYVLLATLMVALTSYLLFFSSTNGGLIFALILGVALAGTDPSSVLLILRNQSGSITRILTVEAIVNTPIVVLVPFLLLDIIQHQALSQTQVLTGVFLQVCVGLGVGVLMGLILFKALRRFYSKEISPVAVIAGILFAYIAAENVGGSGVLSVATMGLLFSNFTIKKKHELQEFSSGLGNILETLIFLLIGISMSSTEAFSGNFLFESSLVFLSLFFARLLATYTTFRTSMTSQEMIFYAATMPKGIAVAVLIFALSVEPIIPQVLLALLFTISIYSIVLSTITAYWWDKRNNDKNTTH